MHKLKAEDTYFLANKHLRLKDKLFDLSKPKIMGIINCTPDSFYSNSRKVAENETIKQVEKFIKEGVDIIDIGGYSSRPGAANITINEEIERTLPIIKLIKKEFNNVPLSLDTFRSTVAQIGLENGIDIINDISAWEIDEKLLDVVAHYKCPYILMHMRGTPENMMYKTEYEDIFQSMMLFFSEKIKVLQEKGVLDIIIDPGFGFSKDVTQNYDLLEKLNYFNLLEKPILVGLSRKSMIYKKLKCSPEEALNGTTILNTVALMKGASILRVHDVREAKEIINLLFE